MNDHGRQVIDLYHQLVDSHLRQTPFDASSRPAFQAWQRKARRILRGIIGELPTEKIDFGLERRVVEGLAEQHELRRRDPRRACRTAPLS